MRSKYRRGVDMVDKKNINFGLLLLVVTAFVLVPAVSATQEYFDALNSTFPSPTNSCGTCHQGGIGGAPRTDYGLLFEKQANHATDPTAALQAIGASGSAIAEFTITPPADITQVATGTLTNITDLGTATTTGGNGTVNITNDAPAEGFPVGITKVTWTATDSTGATVTGIQNVTITEAQTGFTITPPADITQAATNGTTTTMVDLGIATTSGGNGTVNITNDAPTEGFPVGITKVTWTATDSTGATVTGIQNVTITETSTTGAKISGKVFNDLNEDKNLDKGEKGIDNVDVRLRFTDENNKTITLRTETNMHGDYEFSDLSDGEYSIHVYHKDGWIHTSDFDKDVTITNGNMVTANFGKKRT